MEPVCKRQLLIKGTFPGSRQWPLQQTAKSQKNPHYRFYQTIIFKKRGQGKRKRDIICACFKWNIGIWCIFTEPFLLSFTSLLFSPGPEGHLSYCRHFAAAVVFVSISYLIISENTEPNYAGVMFVEFLKSWFWNAETLKITSKNTRSNDLLVRAKNVSEVHRKISQFTWTREKNKVSMRTFSFYK